jgi:hypothetical protein
VEFPGRQGETPTPESTRAENRLQQYSAKKNALSFESEHARAKFARECGQRVSVRAESHGTVEIERATQFASRSSLQKKSRVLQTWIST